MTNDEPRLNRFAGQRRNLKSYFIAPIVVPIIFALGLIAVRYFTG